MRRSLTKHFVLDDITCKSTIGYCNTVCRAKIKHGWVSVLGWSGLSNPKDSRKLEVLHIIVLVSLTPSIYNKYGGDYLNWFVKKFKTQIDHENGCRLYEFCKKMIRLESWSYSTVGMLNFFGTDTITCRNFKPEKYIKDLAKILDKRIQKIKKLTFNKGE